jgi:hypothetical protein
MDQSGKLGEKDALKAVGDGFKKNPADAVSTTFLNQLKSGRLMLPLQAFHRPLLRNSGGHAHGGQEKAPGSQVLAQKTNVNHAHRRG